MKKPVSQLTRQEKLDLIDLLDKKKEANKRSRPMLVPNAGQLPVMQSEAVQRFVFTGNGGGKSALLVHELWWAALGYNPVTKKSTYVPAKVYCVLDKPDKVDSIILPELRKWFLLEDSQLHKDGKPYVARISFKNGSFIKFVFHDQADLTGEGIEADFTGFDEPPPRHLYIGFRRAGRAKGRLGRILFVGTPLAAPWLRTEIYEPWTRGELTGVDCFRFHTKVNEKNLADGYIEEFSKSLNEKEKKIRLEGEFFDLDGNAFGDVFDRSVHVIDDFEWNKAHPCVVAIDPHPSKAHHAVMIGADKHDYLYVIKEMKLKGPAEEFAEEFLEWAEGYRVYDIVCDSLGNTPQSGGKGFLSFIQVIRDMGVMARATSYDDKNDEDWIDRIKSVLKIPLELDNFGNKFPKLRYFKSCKGSIQDTENVQWLKVKNIDLYKPKLDITNKDYLSCIKYALASNISVDKPDKKPYYRETAVTTYGQRESKWQKLFKIHKKEYNLDE